MTADQTDAVRQTAPADGYRMTDCEFDLAVRWFLAVSRAA
jgi:hypothetical protein